MKFLFYLTVLPCFFLMVSCDKKDDNDPVDELIDPADSDALSEVLIMPAGTQMNNGNPPTPTGGSLAPTTSEQSSTIISSNGATIPLAFSYDNVNGNLAGCYVQVDGAGNYFILPYSSTSGVSGQLQLPIGIPVNVDEGSICVEFSVFDLSGRVSNVSFVCVDVLRLGTGSLQISLSWNTETDQDLYVTDPSGTEISYFNEVSSTGGSLDRDDTDGFGPENIYWLDSAPDGQYKVEVNDFEETTFVNTFFITVSSRSSSRSFTGTT